MILCGDLNVAHKEIGRTSSGGLHEVLKDNFVFFLLHVMST